MAIVGLMAYAQQSGKQISQEQAIQMIQQLAQQNPKQLEQFAQIGAQVLQQQQIQKAEKGVKIIRKLKKLQEGGDFVIGTGKGDGFKEEDPRELNETVVLGAAPAPVKIVSPQVSNEVFSPEELDFIKRKWGKQMVNDISSGYYQKLGYNREQLLNGYDAWQQELRDPRKKALKERLDAYRQNQISLKPADTLEPRVQAQIARDGYNEPSVKSLLMPVQDPGITTPVVVVRPEAAVTPVVETPAHLKNEAYEAMGFKHKDPGYTNHPATGAPAGAGPIPTRNIRYGYQPKTFEEEVQMLTDPRLMFGHFYVPDPEPEPKKEKPKDKPKKRPPKRPPVAPPPVRPPVPKPDPPTTKKKQERIPLPKVDPARIDATNARGFYPNGPVRQQYDEHVARSNPKGAPRVYHSPYGKVRWGGGSFEPAGANGRW